MATTASPLSKLHEREAAQAQAIVDAKAEYRKLVAKVAVGKLTAAQQDKIVEVADRLGKSAADVERDADVMKRANALSEQADALAAAQAALRDCERQWRAFADGRTCGLHQRLADLRRELQSAGWAHMTAINREITAAKAAAKRHEIMAEHADLFGDVGDAPAGLATGLWASSVRARLEDFDRVLHTHFRIDVRSHPLFDGAPTDSHTANTADTAGPGDDADAEAGENE